MSYALAAALQEAVFHQMDTHSALSDAVNGAIFDVPPTGDVPPVYVTLGPEEAVQRSHVAGDGARHRFTVSVLCDNAGFHTAKSIAAMVSEALHNARPDLSRGRIIHMQFLRAKASRTKTGTGRRIDLRFEAWVEDE